jgi:hypothetical protein
MIDVSDVATYEDRTPACAFDPLTGLVRIVVFLEIRDEHMRTFAGKRDRHGAPDSRVAPVIKTEQPEDRSDP